MTFKQKIENFWYHYKWHTIIIVFFIITGLVCLVQCSTKEQPDDKALLYVNQNLLDNAANDLSDKLGGYIEDYNGNGEVLYRVNNVSYNSNNLAGVNYSVTNSEKLLSALATAEYVLYIVDEHGYDYLSDNSTEGFESYDFCPDKNGTAWNWKGSSLQQSLADSGLPENLYFCIRKVNGTMVEKNKNVNDLKEKAEKLLQKLAAENPPACEKTEKNNLKK